MCIAISHIYKDETYVTYFSDKNASLQMVSDNIIAPSHVMWGRRKNEQSLLPFGGWITLESANSNYWLKHEPCFTKVLATQFLVQDLINNQQWFDIAPGHFIQGLVLHHDNKKRLYIVTLTQHLVNATYLLWPLIMV